MRIRERPHDYLMLKETYFGNEYNAPDRFEQGSVVIDIGAHIGMFAIRAIHAYAAVVVAVEPDRDNHAVLEANMIEAASLTGATIQAVRCAINDVGGRVFLEKGIHETTNRIGESGEPVVAMPLDAILSLYETVRFLKIDVEGYEQKILAASKMLGRVQELVVEVHPPDSDVDTVRGILCDSGFVVGPGREVACGRVYLTGRRAAKPKLGDQTT